MFIGVSMQLQAVFKYFLSHTVGRLPLKKKKKKKKKKAIKTLLLKTFGLSRRVRASKLLNMDDLGERQLHIVLFCFVIFLVCIVLLEEPNLAVTTPPNISINPTPGGTAMQLSSWRDRR